MRSLDEKHLSRLHAEARAAWPHVDVPLERFRDALLGATSEAPDGLDDVHAADLFLALACLARNANALAAFERQVMGAVRPSVERACRGSASSVDDVMQWTREKVLLGSAAQPPKLIQYSGRGPLVGWIRVVAVREALQERRRSVRRRVVDEAAIVEDGTATGGLEHSMLRERHSASFRAAVVEALARLAPEQRAILRLHTHEGLTIDQLAPLLGVHRATAARRLERARRDALAATRTILEERHGLTQSEARSLCIALGTEVDISLSRALADDLR